jgi:hypothetical protein
MTAVSTLDDTTANGHPSLVPPSLNRSGEAAHGGYAGTHVNGFVETAARQPALAGIPVSRLTTQHTFSQMASPIIAGASGSSQLAGGGLAKQYSIDEPTTGR